ncbi:LCP family protein [uncultured Arthrobacter sp.]|uniref:LCP family protein n=1 Tax=uncultured Arthrobacter sp. TaxID=114050 RepID=UPI0025F5F95B|nr:LCP family protein [uncultured Arthrobacter sp.]
MRKRGCAVSGYDVEHESVVSSVRPKRKHPVRLTLLLLVGLVVVAAVVAGGYLFNLANTFNSKSDTIDTAFPTGERPSLEPTAEGSLNILLLGSDSRAEGEAPDQTGSDGRSDTMMLMHIPADRDDIFVMSILRDTWTELPGHGENKINSAIALGGMPLVVETVETLLDAPIDHVAIIDFEGFKGLTDALGGVEVNNPAAFQSSGADGEFFAQGPVTLQGESALKFVRERYAFSDGDYQRVRNQQVFVKAVLGEVLSANTLTDPGKVADVVSRISPYVSVDEDLDAAAIGRLAVSLRKVRSGDVQFSTLPTLGTGTSADGQSIVVKDEAGIAEVAEALSNDSLGSLPLFSESPQ